VGAGGVVWHAESDSVLPDVKDKCINTRTHQQVAMTTHHVRSRSVLHDQRTILILKSRQKVFQEERGMCA
jgi:hypothetical protein